MSITINPTAMQVKQNGQWTPLLTLRGDAGDAATISVGTVTTGAAGTGASVINTGTSSAAILDFIIPQGERGEAGAGLQISGSVPTYFDLPSTLGPEDAGKAYIVEEDSKLYVWTGTAFPPRGEGSQFVGPQGPKGDKGDTGAPRTWETLENKPFETLGPTLVSTNGVLDVKISEVENPSGGNTLTLG